MYATGSFGVSQTLVGVGFLVPLSVGVAAGDRLRAYVPHTAFDRFVELLLVAVVVGMLLDGLQSIVEVTRVFSRWTFRSPRDGFQLPPTEISVSTTITDSRYRR